MSPIAIRTFRSIPTTYYLNGPTISYGTNQPSNLTISHTNTATFVGITSLIYPSTFPVPPVGVTTYQWFDDFGPIIDETRVNAGGLSDTIISGTATTTLTISNAISPIDSDRKFYLVAYFEPQNAVGFQTFARALNSPLKSNTAVLTIRPYLSIINQPIDVTDTVDDTSTFNVFAVVSDSSGSISYQWRLNGINLSDGTIGDKIVSGANTSSLSIRITTSGTYSIDCVISHPNTDPGSITSNSAVFTVQDNVRYLFYEDMSLGSPGDWMGYPGGTKVNISDFAGGSSLNVVYKDQNIYYFHAPDRDVDALVTMGAPAANSNGGQGGWMTFRYNFKKGVEHTVIIQSREGGGESRHPLLGGGTGEIRGQKGSGGIFFYRLNDLIAVCGGAGGGSDGGAGGDGAAANIPNGTRKGQNGFGVKGGLGGQSDPSNSSPGLVGVGNLDNYWFSGTLTQSIINSVIVNNYGWQNTPDSIPSGVFGPAYAFGGQFTMVDYRSNRNEASRGSKAFRNPRGTVSFINSGLRENTNDCYRFVGYQPSESDGDTRNNKSDFTVADYKAGRRIENYFDANGQFVGPFNPNTSGQITFGGGTPNMYWNKIGNGLGLTPGSRINYNGLIARIENIGSSDDYDGTYNGTTRRTKAVNSRFYRDDPDWRLFVSNNSAEIIRGFRFGYGARNNGGWSRFGGAGGGNGAEGGGSGAGYPNWSGGGGGSGWADARCEVLQSVTGGNIGEGFVSIKSVNPSQPISAQLPAVPISPNPNWQVLNWDDIRNFGWKRDSDGQRWPTEASNGTSYSVSSCSNPNGTYMQAPLVLTTNSDVSTINTVHGSRRKYDSSNIRFKGGLDESYSNYQKLFYNGCKENADPGQIANSTGGNLYVPAGSTNGNATPNGETLLEELRYNRTSGLEQVAYIEFELKLPDFSASRFESYLGSNTYVSGDRPRNSWEFSEQGTYKYTQSNPPSKYLYNDNGVRRRWNPFTDKKTSSGSVLYPSSDRWTNNFDDAYIPFEVTFEMVLEFDNLLYHSDRSEAPSSVQNQYRKMIITKTYNFSSPWQQRTIDFRSSDLWSATATSGSGGRFILPSSDIYNYRNPRITSWKISSVRDLDTGKVNTLNIFPVLEPKKPRDRDYVRFEVGRGVFR